MVNDPIQRDLVRNFFAEAAVAVLNSSIDVTIVNVAVMRIDGTWIIHPHVILETRELPQNPKEGNPPPNHEHLW